ncbi:peptidase inhibitor family I36 protein [Actinosynnema sp. NPDC047251]|uniref:Secreted protein n=1 Tax=Saccharothrix espanaensis (strain ATCC 51144 / DSM 44229 / JCM 9112 / NBRC 15066 / NRRL 15764) TaxID=1179773 RepID=K0K369_SACES|nr:peptidase inhibitor family I36 protein [Saccharothrix espanaensis]CCH30998.1 hypothetical protein BN6_37050 [Saccharothrix espanaensis DSM 44229]
MFRNAVRMALVLPVAALAAVLAPAAHAQSDPGPVAEISQERGYENCPNKHVCAYSQPKGQGNQWVKHQSASGKYDLPWAGRSVYNRTDKFITFYRQKGCKGSWFKLAPGQHSDYAGGAPMGSQVWCISIP